MYTSKALPSVITNVDNLVFLGSRLLYNNQMLYNRSEIAVKTDSTQLYYTNSNSSFEGASASLIFREVELEIVS